MLEIYVVLGLYDDPDGELEARTHSSSGGKGGKAKGGNKSLDMNKELMRAKYGNPMVRRDRREGTDARKKKEAEMANMRRLLRLEREKKRLEEERRRKEEEERKKAAEYKKISVEEIEIPDLSMGKKREIGQRRVTIYLEERKPKQSFAMKMYKNVFKAANRSNSYDPQYEEDNYDPLVVIDDVGRKMAWFRKWHLTNTREIEKRKLPKRAGKVEFKRVKALKSAEDKVCFMGIIPKEKEDGI